MTVIWSSEFPSLLFLVYKTNTEQSRELPPQKLRIKILTVILWPNQRKNCMMDQAGQSRNILLLWGKRKKKYLHDPILRGHLCLSMGKSSRFIIHVAIIVSLWEYRTLPLGNSLVRQGRDRDYFLKLLLLNSPYKTVWCCNCMKIAFLPIINLNCTIRNILMRISIYTYHRYQASIFCWAFQLTEPGPLYILQMRVSCPPRTGGNSSP